MNKLGRKQNITNDEWLEAVRNISSVVSQDELDALVRQTVQDIHEKTSGKTVAYAWS